MAEHFAARLEDELPDRQAQIERAYHLAVSRAPQEEEVSTLVGYANKHGLASACRLIFNLNEFAFAD